MGSTPQAPTYDLFVILEPLLAQWEARIDALSPLLRVAQNGPFLLGASAYFRPDTDVGLLELRFDPRTLTQPKLTWIRDTMARAGLPVLDPERLGDDDRNSFYSDYLPLYPIRTPPRDADEATPEEALRALASAVGRPFPRIGSDSGSHRAASPDVGDDVGEVIGGLETGVGRSRPKPPAGPGWDSPSAATRPAPPDYPRDVDGAPGTSGATDTEVEPRPARGKARARDRALTVPGARHRAASPSPQSPPRARRLGSEPSAPAPGLHVRFLRGDRWVPARLRGLNLSRVRLAAGPPVRLGDDVQVAIAYAEHGVVLRGEVSATATGSATAGSGFEVALDAPTDDVSQKLVALLRRARADGLSLRPPQPRCAPRFPVQWPLHLLAARGDECATRALDISAGGLFACPGQRALSATSELGFQLVDDVGPTPIAGHARIVREVTESMARDRGLDRGFGLEIVHVAERPRFDALLERIRRRAMARVVIGARSERADDLAHELAAVGYSIAKVTTIDGVLALSEQSRGVLDLAVIDDSLHGPEAAGALRSVLEGRHIPCLAVHGGHPRQTREAADVLLKIAS